MLKRIYFIIFTTILSLLFSKDLDYSRYRDILDQFTIEEIRPYLLNSHKDMSSAGFRGAIYQLRYKDDDSYYFTIKDEVFEDKDWFSSDIGRLLDWDYKPDMIVTYMSWLDSGYTTLYYQSGKVISINVIAPRSEEWEFQDDLIDFTGLPDN